MWRRVSRLDATDRSDARTQLTWRISSRLGAGRLNQELPLQMGPRRGGLFGKLSSLLTVKTLTGMTTDVYPRENCIAPAIVFIVWTTDTKDG